MSREVQKHRQSLAEVRQGFEAWRKTRKHRTPIPAELWEAAVSLSPYFSINEISRALRLNHTQLRDRVAATLPEQDNDPEPRNTFIEIAMPSGGRSECIVAMENRYGERMTMHFSGEVSLDLLALSGNFLGRRK